MAAPLEALRLIVILDAAALRGRPVGTVAAHAAAGGATMLQVRGKALAPADLLAAARAAIAAAPALPVVVNDRLDVALAAGAAGCHLGQDDLPLAEARRLAPPRFLLGASAGSVAEAARVRGADYVGIGPVHATAHKDDAGPAIGVDGFARIRQAAGLPAVAIGGVTAVNIPALLAAGAAGIAVIGAVLSATDPEQATRALRTALDTALAA